MDNELLNGILNEVFGCSIPLNQAKGVFHFGPLLYLDHVLLSYTIILTLVLLRLQNPKNRVLPILIYCDHRKDMTSFIECFVLHKYYNMSPVSQTELRNS